MNKICTSIEQSMRLIELGIDVNTADMYYQYFKSYSPSNGVTTGHCDIPIIGNWKEHHISIPDPQMPNADIPAWSLTALWELMPDTHFKKYIYDGKTRYYITKVGIESHNSKHYDNPIDAAFEMVVCLKENNKI